MCFLKFCHQILILWEPQLHLAQYLLPVTQVRRECEWGFMFAHLRDQQTHFPVTLGRALPPVALFTQKQRVPACKSQRWPLPGEANRAWWQFWSIRNACDWHENPVCHLLSFLPPALACRSCKCHPKVLASRNTLTPSWHCRQRREQRLNYPLTFISCMISLQTYL